MSELKTALYELNLAIKDTEKENLKITKMVALLENQSHLNVLGVMQKREQNRILCSQYN